MKRIYSLFLIIFLLITNTIFAQDYYRSKTLKYEDCIYKKSIKSVQLSKAEDPLSLPIISLNAREQLLLQFDELAEDYRAFRFTFIHCDAFWKPTQELMQQEFLDGLFEDQIEDYTFSFNTIQDYINYYKLFPSNKMRLRLSGNYLLVVYEDGYAEDPFFSLRFMVIEPKVTVMNAKAIQDQRPSTHLEKQRIDFGLNIDGYSIPFPDRDLKVVLRQNERWDNAKYLKPLNNRGNILGYAYYNDENVFDGLNEFRYFDIKTLKSNTMNVGRIIRGDDNSYYAYLFIDQPRPEKVYKISSDLNGKFFIKTEDAEDNQLQSEYAWVAFFLKTDLPMSNGDVHIMGNFTLNRIDEITKMTYNFERKGYEISLYLKQGYYEYLYAYIDPTGFADVAFIEGTHWETSNDYYIFVYNKETGEKHDRLVAFEKVVTQ